MSKLTLNPEGLKEFWTPKYYSMSVASLTVICDRLLAITGFLSVYLDKHFFPCHGTTKLFLTWLRSLSMAFVQFFTG